MYTLVQVSRLYLPKPFSFFFSLVHFAVWKFGDELASPGKVLWTSIQVFGSVMRIHKNIFLGELNVQYKPSERQLANCWIRAPPLIGGDHVTC